ncbi:MULTISPECIES: ABC transporter permease [unclassified Streptomyces]|uniref:ABC transporter permease n=1 Tax=unclassified Streptomyces TaxID=2593676 RepID=UPI001586FABA|nr:MULTISPECIES: ABC transporter permease [unclassified Streptomyces]NUV68015.1 ABC transporter permease [Streptomyces sp. CAI-121]NUW00744.1 ABC transporter permease [Streptomyces sp. CAI 127]NUW14427.1 ABC transporter permease [Streptomyces sp. CAI-68]
MTSPPTEAAIARPSFVPLRERLAMFRPGLLLSVAVLVVAALACVAPGLLASASPTDADPVAALLPPGGEHWFGTDQLGRDVYARVVHGARHSLLLGVGATALGVLTGLLIGLPSALLGRFADQVAMRSMDVMLALPELLLALLVIAVVGPSSVNAALAIAVSSVPGYARLVRGQAQVVRRAEYIRSAIGLGLRRRTVVLRHVVPNTLGPLVVPATLGVGTAVIAGSALSFLGLGPKAPTPEWGAMLAQGRDALQSAWWIAVFPGAAITLSVVAVTVVGRQLHIGLEGRPGR